MLPLPLPPYATQPTPSSVLIAPASPARVLCAEVVVRAADLCWSNCDGSSEVPTLNNADFSCFLERYASGSPYGNCDGSTQAPALNVRDFSCFLARFTAEQLSCPSDRMLAGVAVAPMVVPMSCPRGTVVGRGWFGGDGREAREFRAEVWADASGAIMIDLGGYPGTVSYRWQVWTAIAGECSGGSEVVTVRGAGR